MLRRAESRGAAPLDSPKIPAIINIERRCDKRLAQQVYSFLAEAKKTVTGQGGGFHL